MTKTTALHVKESAIKTIKIGGVSATFSGTNRKGYWQVNDPAE